jgi:hypothetical protein
VVVLATLVDAPAAQASPPPMAAEPASAFAVGAAADVGYGTLPHVALGATLSGEWRKERAWPALALAASSWLPQDIRSARGFGGRFWGFRAGLSVCPSLYETDDVRVAACAGAAFGGVRGRGLGLESERAPYRLSANVPVEASLTIRILDGLALRVSAGLSLALLRPTFYFMAADGSRQAVHRPDLLGADVRLGFIVDRF